MNTVKPQIDIKKLATDIANPQIAEGYAHKLINEIYDYFKQVTEVTGQDTDVKNMVTVPANKGMALSINHAAQCFLDYKRTLKFLQGTVKAIKDKQEQFPNEKIHLFYAGCGPYAPFITLVAPLFSTEEIEFSLLEINKDSLEHAEELIENLGLSDYIKKCYLKDATTFEIPNPEGVHILFSETLDALLYRECYVPILWNLIPQLPENTTVIPENVQVKLFFKKGDLEVFNATVFDVRKSVDTQKEQASLPEQFESFPVDLTDKHNYERIILDTEVHIYDDYKLYRNESSLSLALEMEIEKPIIHKSVLFTYHTQPKMELQFSLE